MNVLVYSGPGTTAELVSHCLHTLRRFLSPYYAVTPITAETICKGQWLSNCALLCLPGGADLGYCKALNGTGNQHIKQYVRRGGKFIGFCAGAYFASASVEFERGDQYLEVTGPRELGFFPASCKGAAFKGFQYNSEAGARACTLNVTEKLISMGSPPNLANYYNGGGVFVNAERFAGQGIEILARYNESPHLDAEDGNAAAIGCRIGAGFALLIGTHPEFSIEALKKRSSLAGYPLVLRRLQENENLRVKFVSSLLKLLGLRINDQNTELPQGQMQLHLSCLEFVDAQLLQETLTSMAKPIGDTTNHNIIDSENDVFILETQPPVSNTHTALPTSAHLTAQLDEIGNGKSAFRLKLHAQSWPTSEETPLFNIPNYFRYLRAEQSRMPNALNFGTSLLYGEVVTSTNTILEKNFKLLRTLPAGFTAVASTQTAGRGRGDNIWVSPQGALVFSVVVRHRLAHQEKAPVIFVQYLVGLAVVESIKAYGDGYGDLPVYLKWPNDIYARAPAATAQSPPDHKDVVKIGGILVNASFDGGEFLLVIGCGINVTNEAPTTSLKSLAGSTCPALAAFEHEKLLAKILVRFETLYEKFMNTGFKAFEKDYYDQWLHR
ncbi:biotin holocarboxylase synthetase, variant 2 [Orbilia brochopaga]|uniref:Biotin holocarboxylase synthetase, variant 2 n=1 Tax=Orbilia brochopaga TaxID=3140254 RepID=A0AAV9UHB0_9PEZI